MKSVIQPSKRSAIRMLLWGTLLVWHLATAPADAAFSNSDWQFVQPVTTVKSGLVRISIPPATLDAAQASLADLRILDSTGTEIPYFLTGAAPERIDKIVPRSFRTFLKTNATIIEIETGTTNPIRAIHLQSTLNESIKAASIEGSADRQTWEVLDSGVPIFNQHGISRTDFQISPKSWAHFRVLVSDARSQPAAFLGATLESVIGSTASYETNDVAIRERVDGPHASRFVLDLGSAHLEWVDLQFEVNGQNFARQVNVAIPVVANETVSERAVGGGVIYRLEAPDIVGRSSLAVPMHIKLPTRELIVYIENGDNAPLSIVKIMSVRRPTFAAINLPAAGTFRFFSGNPKAPTPSYDLGFFRENLNQLPIAPCQQGTRDTNAAYHPSEQLNGITGWGSAFATNGWKWRKPVQLGAGELQSVELDLSALSHSQPRQEDLRIVNAGRQIAYIVERPPMERKQNIVIQASAVDPKHPSISRWRIVLPEKGARFSRLTFSSPGVVFQRQFRLFEKQKNLDGEPVEASLATASWSHTAALTNALSMDLGMQPSTAELWLETDNGDNPAIQISAAEAYYPVVHLLFKTPDRTAPMLFYGNPEVASPRYDLSLVAESVLNGSASLAMLGNQEPVGKVSSEDNGPFDKAGVWFWIVLLGVVAGLLFTMARLLPKPK